MQRRVQKNPVLWYYGLTMAASLLLLVPHLLFGVILTPSFSLNQFGPTVGLLLFSLFLGSPAPVRSAFSRFKVKKLPGWGILAVSATAAILFACGKLLSVWGAPFARWGGRAGFYGGECLAMLTGCAAEEVGWRGFLLPELCKKHSLFAGSLTAGLLWGVWHLNFAGGLPGFLLFTASITANSVFLAWLFERSGGNLAVAVLAHFSFNLFSHLFLWNRLGIRAYLVEMILYGFVDLLLVGFDRKLFFARGRRMGMNFVNWLKESFAKSFAIGLDDKYSFIGKGFIFPNDQVKCAAIEKYAAGSGQKIDILNRTSPIRILVNGRDIYEVTLEFSGFRSQYYWLKCKKTGSVKQA